jgi:flagellin
MALESLSLITNQFSINTQKNMSRTEKGLAGAMGRLSSGMRIQKAADDAAGLSIAERLRAQVRGFAQAQRNASDGISLLQTAEGALGEIADSLIRMRELAVQSANGTLGSQERYALHQEYVALRAEIDRITQSVTFNNIQLIDGSFSAGVAFQVGVGNTASIDRITLTLAGARANDIGLTTAVTLSTQAGSQTAIAILDTAINSVAGQRGSIGALQNRFIATINNIQTMHENLSAARGRIADADVAKESADFARTQILMQAGLSVLTQANSLPQMALQLIGG